MADIQTWENIPKSQTDPSTIDEAIADAIGVHDADSEAHMAALSSLAEHRENDIVDHPAESVVNDKIKKAARRYVAIVDPDSETDFDTLESAIDYARAIGGGDIFIVRGIHYVSGDVDVPPTVSLVGEGREETLLRSNTGTNQTIYLRGDQSTVNQNKEWNSASSGATQVQLDSGNSFDYTPIAGQKITGDDFDANEYKTITAYVATDKVNFTPALAASYPGGFLDIYPGMTFTNNSRTVVLDDDQTVANTYIEIGKRIYNLETGFTSTVMKIIDDTSFELKDTFSGTTGSYGAQCDWVSVGGQYVQDMTIGDDANTLTLKSVSSGDALVISGVDFVGDQRLWEGGLGAAGKVLLLQCTFDCYTTTEAVRPSGCVFINCVFNARANSAKGAFIAGTNTFQNCYFEANSYTGIKWFNCVNGELITYDCTMESVLDGYIGCEAGLSSFGPVSHNRATITMHTNNQLQVVRDDCYFANCFITHTTGYPCAINSAADRTKFVGCKTTEAITDAGIASQILGDAISNFVTAGTSDTAMAFATRKMVQLTPNSTRTLTTTVPYAGREVVLKILTSGTTSYTLTFGSGFKSTGTLATGTTSSRVFIIRFVSDGTKLYETSRTVAMVA